MDLPSKFIFLAILAHDTRDRVLHFQGNQERKEQPFDDTLKANGVKSWNLPHPDQYRLLYGETFRRSWPASFLGDGCNEDETRV